MFAFGGDASCFVNIHPDQGQVIINGEQIEPWDFFAGIGAPFEDISGEFYKGVTRIGGFWFGVRRSEWQDINAMTYIVSAPSDSGFERLGDDFVFELDMSAWEFMPIDEDVIP